MNLNWAGLWQQALERVAPGTSTDVRGLWPALVVLGLVLVWPRARRWGRVLVTIVHEAGHAAVGLAVGRRFRGFVVEKNLSGHAVTSGRSRGLGRVLTTWAGYPFPAVVGALMVLGAVSGWAGALLAGCVLSGLGLLVMSRSVRTFGLICVVGLLAGLLWWYGGTWRDAVVAGVGVALLVGAWDSLGDVTRSTASGQDHRTLASLTPLPTGAWLSSWFLADLLATASALWIVVRRL